MTEKARIWIPVLEFYVLWVWMFIAKVKLGSDVCSCDAVMRGKPAPSVESQNLDNRSLHNSEFFIAKVN